MRRLFWLYRPTAPSVRAQSIQVVHAAHASAARGHQVTVCVQAAERSTTAAGVLDFYGLHPVPTLDLRVLPVRNTAASLAFRAAFGEWALGGGGVAIARSKRYAVEAARWSRGVRIVLEAHEVDSLQAEEAGRDSAGIRDLETRALAASVGVICNCEGTERLLRQAHAEAPPTAVLHNASRRDRIREPAGPGQGIGYVGSLRAAKDPGVLADAARQLERPVVVVGPERDEALVARSGGWLRFEPALAHRDVPDRLARFAAVALPVGGGLFGEQLTSPLKLWDYLGCGRPIVAADTPALRAAAGEAAHYWPVGDARALATAVAEVLDDAVRRQALVVAARARFRTWDERAAELDGFLERVAP